MHEKQVLGNIRKSGTLNTDVMGCLRFVWFIRHSTIVEDWLADVFVGEHIFTMDTMPGNRFIKCIRIQLWKCFDFCGSISSRAINQYHRFSSVEVFWRITDQKTWNEGFFSLSSFQPVLKECRLLLIRVHWNRNEWVKAQCPIQSLPPACILMALLLWIFCCCCCCYCGRCCCYRDDWSASGSFIAYIYFDSK